MTTLYRMLKNSRYTWLILAVAALYFIHITADSISGIFGVMWSDEGAYLLSAKNQVLFGQAHFFLKDLWQPELIAPLLYRFGLLTITKTEPVLWLRAGMAVCILSGMGIVSWLCSKYYSIRQHGLVCFFWLMMNPVLFFYARIGLSEGLQFFIFTLILACLFYLHASRQFSQALGLSIVTGALIAILVMSKISAAPAGGVLCAAAIYTIASNRALPRRRLLSLVFILSGLLLTAAFFRFYIGDQLLDWYRANIEIEVTKRAPDSLQEIFDLIFLNIQNIAFFLCFMPVFALYFLSLIFAADRSKGFLFILWLITLGMITAESCLGGEIRRNFYSLSMLSILFGFCALDFFRFGVRSALHLRSRLQWIGGLIIALHILGVIYAVTLGVWYRDYPLAIFCLLFPVLFLLLFLGRRQSAVLAIVASASLMPMLFQDFLAPHTTDDIASSIESRVPENAIITGPLAPWFLSKVKRRVIFTNCSNKLTNFQAANDIETVESMADYFIGDQGSTTCLPLGVDDSNIINIYTMFSPMNQINLWILLHHIGYSGMFYLYEK